MAILLGLLAAAFSGTGDFMGGLASRHGRIPAVGIYSHVAGVATTFLVAPFFAGSPSLADLGWGAAAGACGGIAILSLYTGFTKSDIAVVSPIAAVGAAAFPVVFSVTGGETPGALEATGLGLGIVAIWLISRERSLLADRPVGIGMLYGLGAGLGFGGLLILLSLVSEDAGIWPLAPARLSGALILTVVALVFGREAVPMRSSWLPLAAAGALTIFGNGAFILGTHRGSLAVVSVLAAMFPAATVLLARIVFKERLSGTRLIGLVTALVAVGLVAAA